MHKWHRNLSHRHCGHQAHHHHLSFIVQQVQWAELYTSDCDCWVELAGFGPLTIKQIQILNEMNPLRLEDHKVCTSLFADDCVLLFQSRDDLIRRPNYIFDHLRKIGLCMHVGRGDAASKTVAMYFPPPRTAYEAVDTSRFFRWWHWFYWYLWEVQVLGFHTPLLAYLWCWCRQADSFGDGCFWRSEKYF